MVGKTYYIEYNHITLFVSKSSLATSTNRIKARALTMYIKLICNQWNKRKCFHFLKCTLRQHLYECILKTEVVPQTTQKRMVQDVLCKKTNRQKKKTKNTKQNNKTKQKQKTNLNDSNGSDSTICNLYILMIFKHSFIKIFLFSITAD